MTKERQRQVLIALLLVLAVMIGWRVMGPRLGSDGATLVDVGRSSGLLSTATKQVETVRLADLDRGAAEFKLGRDPFRFVVAQAARQPARERPPAQKPAAPAQRPAPSQANSGQQRPTPQPPPVDVVYLGRFGSSERPIAVFSDGNEIYNVLEGGVLKKHFVVDKIGYESADLKFVDFPDTPSKRLAVGG